MVRAFDGKVATVTGAASGIGYATAARFAREGARVVLADVDVDAGRAAAERIVAAGGEATFVTVDVTLPEDVDAMVDLALSRYGRLDAAANMAGINLSGGLFVDAAARDMCMAINMTGTFNCVSAQVEAMRRSPAGGAIVNCSSVGGLRGAPYSPYYSAAKHAVIGFSKSVALEWAPHAIRVNVVAPGITRSLMLTRNYDNVEDLVPLMPIGRLGEPQDQANAVVWLCSGEASFVTGAVFSIDGGQMAGSPVSPKPGNDGKGSSDVIDRADSARNLG